MAESLGSAVLELNADAGPLTKAVGAAHLSTIKQFKATATQSKAAMAAGMLAVGAAIGVGLVAVGKEFDSAFDEIRVRTGATGKELESLKGSFRNVFRDVPDDATTVGKAIGDVNTRLGLTGENLEGRTKQFLNLSRITGTDVTTNIEKVSKAFKDWEVGANRQGDVLDGFFRISQKTGISVADLAGKVQQFGSPLRQLGFTLGESASMFGIFEAAGVNVETLMPGFKMAIGNVVDPTDDLRRGMNKLGIDLNKGPKVAIRQFISTLENAKNPAEMTGIAMDFFGRRAGADMVEAIGQGRLSVEDMMDVFKNGKDTINGASDDTMDFAEKLDILKNRGMLALERPAMLLFDALTKLSDVAIALTDAFSGLPSGVKKTIGIIATVAATVITLTYAFGKAKAAFMALQLLMMANPYALLIAATVAIVVLIVKNWDTIKDALSAAWNWIKDTAAKIWGAIKEFFVKHWDEMLVVFMGPLGFLTQWIIKNWKEIRDKAKSIWKSIKDAVISIVRGLRDALVSVWTAIKSAAQTYWSLVKNVIINPIRAAVSAVRSAIGGVRDWLRGAFQTIRDFAASIWQGVRDRIIDPIKSAVERVKAAISDVKGWLSDRWGEIASRVGQFGSSIREKLVTAFKGAANAVIGFINAIIGAINKIPGVPDIGKVGKLAYGGTLSSAGASNEVPGYAEGGKVTKPMAIVGEEAPRHPEYVIPTNPAYRGRALALTGALMKELGAGGVPGYGIGGVIGGAASAIGNLITGGASSILKLLPNPADLLPAWLQGMGKYVIDKVTGYIKEKVKDAIDSIIPGSGGSGGGTGTGALAALLAKIFNLTITSGYRSPAHNDAIGGATGSSHTKGTPANPGAHDFVPPTGAPGTPGAAGAFAMSRLGAIWADNHDYGSGLHQHVSWFAKGGLLDRLGGRNFLGSFGSGGVLPSDGLYFGHEGEHVGRPPVVNIKFADGMGWLRDFVDIAIEGADRKSEQVYAAGVVR